MNESQHAETVNINSGYSLIADSFFGMGGIRIETLETLSGENNEGGIIPEEAENSDTGIIQEREGIHYINQEALKSGSVTDENLNLNFKKLVDSIVK